MKKAAVIALALLFVVAPLVTSCTEKATPDKKSQTTQQKQVRRDTLAPGWGYIIYEPIPF